METIPLKSKVTIVLNSKSGEVRGIWHTIEGQVKYQVRYLNDVGSVIDDWFVADDLIV